MKRIPKDLTQWLRKSKISIPSNLNDKFPDHKSLIVGYCVSTHAIYICGLVNEGPANHELFGSINVVPKKGLDYNIQLRDEARSIATDSSEISKLLLAYLNNDRKLVGEPHYNLWDPSVPYNWSYPHNF